MDNSYHVDQAAHYLPRPRLDHIFDKAVGCQLVLVTAGAGFGKTQAMRHYLKRQENAIVRWLQLTEGNNTASRLWESIAHVVAMDNPQLAAQLRAFGFPQTPTRFKQFAEILDSTEHQSRDIIFVLDDFHLISSKDAIVFLERCLHIPDNKVRVFVLSRKEPEINAASLDARGKIYRITEDELRFTAAEIMGFFCQRAITCTAQELTQLIAVTKGWALAINMFSLILKKMPHYFEHALDAMTQNIFKLFELEVWADFPPAVQKTIVKLSLLSALPIVSLQTCKDTQCLQSIPQLASFIWFDSFTNSLKVHPLYLEFLQSKQHVLSPQEKQQIYCQAAQWCGENNFFIEAIYYYAKSHQYQSIIKALFSFPLRLPSDASEYFLDILERLIPGENNDPNVLFLKDYFIPLLLIGAGKYEQAQQRAFAVIQAWENVHTPLAIAILYAIYSVLAYLDMYICTVSHQYNGPQYLKKSLEYFKLLSIAPIEKTVAFINADVRSFACLVGEGATLSEFEQFQQAAQQTALLIEKTPDNIYAGYEDLVACEIAFFKNQPELARKHAHNAIVKARKNKQYSIALMAENYLLRIATQQGDVLLTKEILKQLRSSLDNLEFRNRQLYYDLFTGAFYAYIGQPELVPQWLVTEEKEVISEIHIPVRELYVSVLYLISCEKYHQALGVLCNAYPREPHDRFLFGELRFLLLTAVAKIKTDDTVGAVADFEQAYEMSFQGVFELFFLELGKNLHHLVSAAQRAENCRIPRQWLTAIDRKAAIYTKKVAVIANALNHNAKHLVALSEREQEVLLDLYHGLSREEIATNRYLSINTVKKILQSIYTKLDAHNNIDAIRIALEQKLIE